MTIETQIKADPVEYAHNYNEIRFYKRRFDGQFAESIKELVDKSRLSNHDRLREDPLEAPKLAAIEHDLSLSPRLKLIDLDIVEFEETTNRDFNHQANTKIVEA